jgi:hypothetical protein
MDNLMDDSTGFGSLRHERSWAWSMTTRSSTADIRLAMQQHQKRGISYNNPLLQPRSDIAAATTA